MRIYSMTATFGKLEQQTLTLQPGLNILHAPNEWGKSTWCAFLVNMLYGMETRTKTTKTVLSDKEHYAPWSGSPMSGRVELNWDGRDITIERWTKGKTPMGEFRAYETKSGTSVPELTAQNCGEMLLGVERSVFQRSSFIRLQDLPVTQDETLRRRLNALVTTGDESGTGDKLAKQLKALKNQVRYNNTGLLPKAEAELLQVQDTLWDLKDLTDAEEKSRQRLAQVDGRIAALNNHLDALRYQACLDEAEQVENARNATDQARRRLEEIRQRCDSLPSRETACQKLEELKKIQQQATDLEMESRMTLREAEMPEIPACFTGISEDAISQRVDEDVRLHEKMTAMNRKPKAWCLIPGPILLAAGIWCALEKGMGWLYCLPGVLALILGLVWLMFGYDRRKHARATLHTLSERYGTSDPQAWIRLAADYRQGLARYREAREKYRRTRDALEERAAGLRERLENLCGGETLSSAQNRWTNVVSAWDALADARRELVQAESNEKIIVAMAKPVPPPSQPDELVYTESETLRILSDAAQEQQELRERLGKYQGRMDAIGDKKVLEAKAKALTARIEKLKDYYAALDYAQKALAEAALDLQRRFAPKIAARAQYLFGRLTGGRYDRFSLSEDLSVNTGAVGQNTLRTALWCSDGTSDQLYLALRLAVAGELTPDAPLVLDDALVRFDDDRLRVALEILQEEAEGKQIILFTCHSREKKV